jgi:NAD-dependent deacetylase
MQLLHAAEAAARDCELMLVVGTSGLVYPAAGLPRIARRAGARVVVINPAESDLDDVADTVIRATAAVTLPRLFAR